MDIILQGLDYVACIQDDILISGTDNEDHLRNLGSVLQRLDDYGLRLKLERSASSCKPLLLTWVSP